MMVSEQYQTLIGVVIIKFSLSLILVWGSINLYILSYFHQNEPSIQINANTNSRIIMVAYSFCTVAILCSNKIAVKLGDSNCIHLYVLIWVICFLVSLVNFSFWVVVVFQMMIPSVVYSLIAVPCLKCLYSHFQDDKSKVTGIVLCSYGIGSIFWNLFSTAMMNPENLTSIQDGSDLSFFSEEISSKVPFSVRIIFLITSVLLLAGSFLVSMKAENQSQNNHIDAISDEETRNQESLDERISICTLLREKFFLVFCLMAILSSSYQTFVILNAKIIYIEKLEDDHLISVGIILLSASGAFCSLIWGWLGDKLKYFKTIIIFLVLDLISKTFSTLIATKIEFIVSMILLGSTNNGIVIIFGPILLDKFGFTNGSDLLPFKTMTVLLSGFLPMLIKSLFKKTSNYNFLLPLCILSFLTVPLFIMIAQNLRTLQRMQLMKIKKEGKCEQE